MELIWLVKFLLNLAMQLLNRSQKLSGSRSYEDKVRDVNCSVKAHVSHLIVCSAKCLWALENMLGHMTNMRRLPA